PVEQVDRARPRGGQAHTQLACDFGICAGHECRRLFVPHLYEVDLVLAGAQRLHDAVDAVAGKPKDILHIPVHQGLNQLLRFPPGIVRGNQPATRPPARFCSACETPAVPADHSEPFRCTGENSGRPRVMRTYLANLLQSPVSLITSGSGMSFTQLPASRRAHASGAFPAPPARMAW